MVNKAWNEKKNNEKHANWCYFCENKLDWLDVFWFRLSEWVNIGFLDILRTYLLEIHATIQLNN